MELHSKQKEIVRSNARFKICRSGRRSGKSSVAIEIMLFTAFKKKDRNIFYISPTQKQSRSIIWEHIKSRLNGLGILNESRLEIELPAEGGGKSRIMLAGFETRENFRGLKADLIVFDEVDSMPSFFLAWQEIFRPTLVDTGGKIIAIGTPKKENPNLRRLEKLAQSDRDFATFHFTSWDNPYLDSQELEKAKKELDFDTYRQEILAEYLDNAGALFRYDSLIDVFSNSIVKDGQKYLIIDVADDGSDKTIFSFWDGMEEYRREEFEKLNTESIINQTREYAAQDQIPYSHIAVDAIGVGAGVASSSLLAGIIGYKGSYGAIKTDHDPVKLPNVHYLKEAPLTTDYKNLRSQCIFTLAEKVNSHAIASRVTGKFKEVIIEELSNYQDASSGDGKRMATPKEKVKEIIGRSPDHSDTWQMRCYFDIRSRMIPEESQNAARLTEKQQRMFRQRKSNFHNNSNK